MKSEYELDVRNQLCPLPVIRTQNRIKNLHNHDILHVLCTDPGTLNDIPAWCRIHGHRVIETKEHDNEITIIIEVQNNNKVDAP
ncbi:MAG: sulfurtransferase TusA family protein [Gammaproteobacteria bacterium]